MSVDSAWLDARKAEVKASFGSPSAADSELKLSLPANMEERMRSLRADLSTASPEAWQDSLLHVTAHVLTTALSLPDADMYTLARHILCSRTAWESMDVCRAALAENLVRQSIVSTRRHEILDAIEYVRVNFSRNISQTDVARWVGLSTNYFSNLFKKEMGLTFSSYLTGFRVDKARELLVSTSLYSYEIAEKCGFSDDTYFSRIFLNTTGLRPSAFRQAERDN